MSFDVNAHEPPEPGEMVYLRSLIGMHGPYRVVRAESLPDGVRLTLEDA